MTFETASFTVQESNGVVSKIYFLCVSTEKPRLLLLAFHAGVHLLALFSILYLTYIVPLNEIILFLFTEIFSLAFLRKGYFFSS